MTGRHQGPKHKLRAGVARTAHMCKLCLFASTWRPLMSVVTTRYNIAKITFHRRV